MGYMLYCEVGVADMAKNEYSDFLWPTSQVPFYHNLCFFSICTCIHLQKKLKPCKLEKFYRQNANNDLTQQHNKRPHRCFNHFFYKNSEKKKKLKMTSKVIVQVILIAICKH